MFNVIFANFVPVNRRISYGLFFLLLAFIWSCATVVPPEGGPKDTTAPVPLNYSPKNKVRNYKGQRISVRFDEFIELKDMQSQLVVSPAMPENPDIYVKGKRIIIETPDSLEPNTTYTIFLGNAVVNYTENIPVKNFQYVLSTGEFLDSLRITGVVKNAFDLKTEEGILVMLYKDTRDSTPYLKRPYYLAKTYGQGSFVLDNLSEGNYLIFALKDLNSNYLYDQPSEEIAFLDSLVVSAPAKSPEDTLNLITPTEVNLWLFKEIQKKQGVVSHKVISPQKIFLELRRKSTALQLEVLDTTLNDWYYPVENEAGDSLYLWLTKPMPDTIHLKVMENTTVLDTLRFVLKKPERKNRRAQRNRMRAEEEEEKEEKEEKAPRIVVSSNTGNGLDFFTYPALKFNTPVQRLDLEKIHLYRLQDSTKIPLEFQAILRDSAKADVLYLKCNLQESQNYRIEIPDSVFYDIFSHTHDSLEFAFKTTKKRSYGSLELNIQYSDSIPLIIQLLDAKDGVLEEHLLTDSLLLFPYLKPGSYKIKAIADRNNNGKWDTGDYLQKLLPERVFYMKEAVQIRANWDVEQRWILE